MDVPQITSKTAISAEWMSFEFGQHKSLSTLSALVLFKTSNQVKFMRLFKSG